MKPIYIPPFMPADLLDEIEKELLGLQWETKTTARHEYFMAEGKVCPCVTTCKVQDFSVTLPSCPNCDGTGYIPVHYSYGNRGRDAALEAKRLEWVRSHPEAGSLQERVNKALTLFPGVTYTSKPWSREVLRFKQGCAPESAIGQANGCFLNKYDDQFQHLGWHADDFEGMDPAAPIAVMSFGAEREIWIKPKQEDCPTCNWSGRGVGNCGEHGCVNGKRPVKGAVPTEDRFLLQRGSLFIMPPGFQEVMLHRIPKHPKPCGWRISLTFRKFL